MPQRPTIPISDSRLRGALHDMHAIAASLYRTGAERSTRRGCSAYLDQRGVSVDLIEAFELGFSDPQGQA